MCYLKDLVSLFFISFYTGLIFSGIYINEKRINSLEKNCFILENKIEDLLDILEEKKIN